MDGTTEKSLNLKSPDDLIRHLGHPGRFQILVFILMALNYFPVVFHHVCMAFYGYTPPFQCQPERVLHSGVVPEQHAASALTSYRLHGVNATATKKSPVIFRSCDVLVTSEGGVNRTDQCKAGQFRYQLPDQEKTVVMEWDLVCDQAYLTHLTTTVYYCGVMLGGFVCGYLSDYFGRRPVILTTLAGITLIGTSLAFVRDFPTFVALRFALGLLMQVS